VYDLGNQLNLIANPNGGVILHVALLAFFFLFFLPIPLTCGFYFYQGWGYCLCRVLFSFLLQSQTRFSKVYMVSQNLEWFEVETEIAEPMQIQFILKIVCKIRSCRGLLEVPLVAL